MPRSRNLKPGFFKNEDLVALGYEAMICFAGLWTLADREGRLEDRPKRIKAEILPYTEADVDALLDSLADAGFIRRYSTVDSSLAQVQPKVEPSMDQVRPKHDYLVIHTWFKHQRPHYKEAPSIIPPPPAASKHNKPQQKSEYESTTPQPRPKVDSSMDQSKRFLPSDPLSSDPLSLDSLRDTPLPPSETETASESRKGELTRADQITVPEPGVFDVQNGWREFSARYPNQTGVDAACRWYISGMATRKPSKQIELHIEIMDGLNRHLKCGKWRNRETGEMQLQFIPGMDRFLGVPKESDPSRGKMYSDRPAEWQPPADPQPKRDSGSYLREQIGGTPT